MIFAFYPEVIYYALSSIPRGVIPLLTILLISLLLKKKTISTFIVLLTITVAIVFYHPVTAPFVILIITSIGVLQFFISEHKTEPFVTSSYLFLASTITIAYWIFRANDIFESIISSLASDVPSNISLDIISQSPIQELANYLAYSIIIAFINFGLFYSIKRKKETNSRLMSFIFMGAAISIFALPGPLLLVGGGEAETAILRFGLYASIVMSVTAAAGIAFLIKSFKKGRLIAMILILAFCFLSISNDFNASDNPLIKRPAFYTFFMYEGELASIHFTEERSTGLILSDYVATRYLMNSNYSNKSHIMEVSKSFKLLKSSDDDVLVIRENELKKRPLQLFVANSESFELHSSWAGRMSYFYYSDLKNREGYSNIYSSEFIRAYV
jgi:hypothetical protein